MDGHNRLKMGVPAIDSQHREMYDICHRFLAAARAHESTHLLCTIFDQLIGCAREHFRSEEDILDRHGYPTLASHRAKHDRLLVQAEHLRARWAEIECEQTRRQVAVDTGGYLMTWLEDHILADDRPYQTFLRRLA